MQHKQNVNDVLGPALLGKDVTDQQGLDDLMIKLDGTHNKVQKHTSDSNSNSSSTSYSDSTTAPILAVVYNWHGTSHQYRLQACTSVRSTCAQYCIAS
jgi:enolase